MHSGGLTSPPLIAFIPAMSARIAALAMAAALALETGAAEAQDPDSLPESPFKGRLLEEHGAKLEAENARLQEKIVDLQVQIFELVQAKPEFAPWYSTDPERFELWTDCQPMALMIYVSDETEGGARLTEESVRSAVESRLRAARLYSDDADVWLDVAVVRGGSGPYYGGFSMTLRKVQFDLKTRLRGPSVSWERNLRVGVGPVEFVRSKIAEEMDEFLVDYLRVNDEACGGLK